jgi:hypothetical protein
VRNRTHFEAAEPNATLTGGPRPSSEAVGSAVDDEGRSQCSDCGKMVRVHNEINGRWLCIDCWELAYQVKHGMMPNVPGVRAEAAGATHQPMVGASESHQRARKKDEIC